MKKQNIFRKITMKVLTMQLNSVSLMDLLAYGGAAIGILTALLQFQADQLTILGVILFILLSSEFFIPLRLLGSFFHVAMNGKAASDKIFHIVRYASGRKNPNKRSGIKNSEESRINKMTPNMVNWSAWNCNKAVKIPIAAPP